jgi:hypothetical protein
MSQLMQQELELLVQEVVVLLTVEIKVFLLLVMDQ